MLICGYQYVHLTSGCFPLSVEKKNLPILSLRLLVISYVLHELLLRVVFVCLLKA